jgi:hypothetical protein
METVHEALENVDHVEGTGDEVLDFSSARIDDFLPWFEVDGLEPETTEPIDHRAMCIEVSFESFESGRAPRSIRVFAPDPFDMLGGQRDDEPGRVDVVAFDLLASVRGCGKTDASQGFTCPPTDGLSVHGQSSSSHHIEIRTPCPEKCSRHHGTGSVPRADHEIGRTHGIEG